jgi:hypothetical protein
MYLGDGAQCFFYWFLKFQLFRSVNFPTVRFDEPTPEAVEPRRSVGLPTNECNNSAFSFDITKEFNEIHYTRIILH